MFKIPIAMALDATEAKRKKKELTIAHAGRVGEKHSDSLQVFGKCVNFRSYNAMLCFAFVIGTPASGLGR